MNAPSYVVRISGKTPEGAIFNGTGFFVSAQGHVITCLHVVSPARGGNVTVQLPYTSP